MAREEKVHTAGGEKNRIEEVDIDEHGLDWAEKWVKKWGENWKSY